MKDLIEALTIFMKYVEEGSYQYNFPFHCEHDILIVNVEPDQVTDEEDKKRLDELGFFVSEEYDTWASFKFGSC